MGKIRNSFNPQFKANVTLKALKEGNTLEELSSAFGVSSSQILRWRKFSTENFAQLFENKKDRQLKEKDLIIADLYQEIGKLKMEYEWLKKKLGAINL